MDVASVRAAGQVPAASRSVARAAAGELDGPSFGDMLGRALEDLSAMEQRADGAAAAFAAGGPVDLHDALIASEETSIAFQLALQLRNKAVEAYQEIMRMQV